MKNPKNLLQISGIFSKSLVTITEIVDYTAANDSDFKVKKQDERFECDLLPTFA